MRVVSNRVSAQLYALAGCDAGGPAADADLLAGHIAGDPDALPAVLDRHGPAVLRVCRAHLSAADADDAFQATILVFLRDARRIRDGRSLAGWLVRVAHLVCLKARRNAARRRVTPLAVDSPGCAIDPSAAAEAGDLSAAVCAELARLPAKLRAVVVLCVMEDRSNAEAARVLNVPRGTVDSRLFHAKARLRAGLTRRGVGPAAALVLTPTAATTAAHAARLASALPRLATAPPAVLTLVSGVSTTMSLMKLATAGVLAAGLIGTAGWGIVRGQAQDDAPPKEQATKPADAKAPKPGEKVVDPPATAGTLTVAEKAVVLTNETALRGALKQPFPIPNMTGLTLDAMFQQLESSHGIVIRFDTAAISRFYPAGYPESEQMREAFVGGGGNPGAMKVPSSVHPNGTVAEVLADLTACLPGKLTYRVRGTQVLITPSYIPPTQPIEDSEAPTFARHYLNEQRMGPPVSIALQNVPLSVAVEQLRTQTGANVVILPSKEVGPSVTATLDDVRLLTALDIVADMAGQSVILIGNVYYVASPETIQRLQDKHAEEPGRLLPVVPKPITPMG